MIAAKAMDPVLGVDIHIVQPPGPVPPVPVPHPFIGMLIDPMDFAPVIGATVLINGMPRATAGTGGQCVPPHIPIGGVFVKPPGNECEVFMGSASVLADGDPLARLGMPALSCHDVGMPPPPRLKKKRKPKSLTLPTSVVLAVPAGAPVLVGGAPTISMMALGMKAAMGGLGKLAKKSKRLLKAAKKRAFRNMKPGFLKCTVLKAEPVNILTGEVEVDNDDFELSWPLPLIWKRTYRSGRTRNGACGRGWETPADARIELQKDSSVLFHDGNGVVRWFAGLPDSGTVLDLTDGARLHRSGSELVIQLRTGERYRFDSEDLSAGEALVSRITSRSGHQLAFVRSADGLRAIESDSGPTVAVESRDGRIERMVLIHPGHRGTRLLVCYEYDPQENLAAVVDPFGNTRRYGYDNHRLVRHTDRNGLSFYYRYDRTSPDGRVVAAWGDGELYSYTFEYEEGGARTRVTDSRGGVSTFEMNANGLPFRETDPLGAVTAYEYDDAGRCSAVVDPLGFRAEYRYDGRGNLLLCVRPDGTEVRYEWDDDDRLVSVRDPRGSEWRQEWDDRGLLRSKIDPEGNAWHFDYDATGLLQAEVDPRGFAVRYERDTWGRVIRRIDDLGRETGYAYDALGEVRAVIDSDGRRTETERDAAGRLRKLRSPSGSVHELAYDGEGNLLLERDAEGFVTRYEYAGLGQIAGRLEGDGRAWSYAYDTEEKLVAVRDPIGRQIVLERDAAGRVVCERDPWNCATRYDYDPCGRVTTSVDPLGRTQNFEHDALGRLRSCANGDGSASTYAYDANGNLLAARRGDVELLRSYDSRNLITEEAQGPFWIRTSFDATGNLVRRESSFGNIVEFRYDAANQLSEVVVNERARIEYRRDRTGRPRQEIFTDHCRTELTWDEDDQLLRQRLRKSDLTLSDVAYGYDRRGCLTLRREGAGNVQVLKRDEAGRVLTADSSGGERWTARLDGAGSSVGDVEVRTGPSWARRAAGAAADYIFDAAGNTVARRAAGSLLRLEWDASNRLVRASDVLGNETRFTYDALGRRIEKHSGRGTLRFGWFDEWLCLEEEEGGARREIVYVPGGFEPLALIVDGGETLFFQREPNGAPFQLVDGAGRIAWSCRYSPAGDAAVLVGAEADPHLRLLGQYIDPETSLVCNGARYFDPLAGRFLSQDPIGLEGGDDLYEFGPSIWEWVDPLGLTCRPGRPQVFAHFPTRKRANDARPRPKPHLPKSKRPRGAPLTRQDKNKIGTGNNPDHIHKPGQDPHFHDDAHTNPDKPNVHYSYPK